MTPELDNPLLGMIVDRSSFDDEDGNDDDLFQAPEEVQNRRRKDGKIRRKLRWKPAAFRATRKRSMDVSIATSHSRTSKSTRSFHTIHSTETPVQSNQSKPPPIKTCRPHYRDTFDGVSTIDNEGQYIHSKNSVSHDEEFARSRTLPLSRLDSFNLPGNNSDGYMSDGKVESLSFDPFGNELTLSEPQSFCTSRRPPRDFQPTKQSSFREITLKRKRPIKTRRHEVPLLVDSDMGVLDTSLILQDLENRQVSPFSSDNETDVAAAGLGILPITIPPKRSPFATPLISRLPTVNEEKPSKLKKLIDQTLDISKASACQVLPTDGKTITSFDLGNASFDRSKISTWIENKKQKVENNSRDVICMTLTRKFSNPQQLLHSHILHQLVDTDEAVFAEAERNLQAIHEMAAEHLCHGEYTEALEVFEEILRGQKERYGADHYRIGTALHNIGIVHLRSGNSIKAVEICLEAVKVRKQTLVTNHPDVAVSLAQLGVARLEYRQYREALIAFREALQIRRDFMGPKHPKVGKILNNIGCTLYEMNELEGARLAFEEALDIQRETLRGRSLEIQGPNFNSNQILLSIGATLCNLGSIKVRCHQHDKATIALEEALLIQQSVLGDEHPTVLNTIESIKCVEASGSGNDFPSLDYLFSFWITKLKTKTTTDPCINKSCNNDNVVNRMVNMLSASLTWKKPSHLYQKIELYLPQHMSCGNLSDVHSDNTVSDCSSTSSFRQARKHGFEI